MDAVTARRALLLGLGCAVWTLWWTRDQVPARYVIPAVTLLSLVLMARWPVRAGFGLAALLAAYPLMDVHVDNGSFLMPTLLGSMILLFGNSFGAHATAYQLTAGQIPLVPLAIGNQISGDVLHNVGLGYAIACIAVATLAAAPRRP